MSKSAIRGGGGPLLAAFAAPARNCETQLRPRPVPLPTAPLADPAATLAAAWKAIGRGEGVAEPVAEPVAELEAQAEAEPTAEPGEVADKGERPATPPAVQARFAYIGERQHRNGWVVFLIVKKKEWNLGFCFCFVWGGRGRNNHGNNEERKCSIYYYFGASPSSLYIHCSINLCVLIKGKIRVLRTCCCCC